VTHPTSAELLVIMIATPLSAELVEQIRSVDDGLKVLYEPDLLPPTRYPCDHRGEATFRRDPDGERRWGQLMAQAEVMFGIPGDSPDGLADAVRASPRLRWVQATSAGAAEQVSGAALSDVALARVAVTSASGVHTGPLAEFCILGLLAFTKDLPRLMADKQARHWNHYPVDELRGRTLLIVGLGKIGAAVAHLAKALGMRVLAINRSGNRQSSAVDEMHTMDELTSVLATVDAVVVTLPLTDDTRGVIDAEPIAAIKLGTTFVNVGRDGVVDETALIQALREGKLAGAALDVFAVEPLPDSSPLWGLPNVLLSPHTTALSLHENERIVELFADNLRRYMSGDKLRNRIELASTG
jgi:phosphoglycerate dehydrogenase-like enzyme